MPWKLIVLIFIMALVLVFTGFNLGNAGDLSLVFVTLKAVPVALIALSGFLLGLLTALVLVIGRKRPAKKVPDKPAHSPSEQSQAAQVPAAEPAPDGNQPTADAKAPAKTRRIRGGGRQVP